MIVHSTHRKHCEQKNKYVGDLTKTFLFFSRFHFPLGNPASSPSGDLTKFADEFRKHKNSCVTLEELGQILKVSKVIYVLYNGAKIFIKSH